VTPSFKDLVVRNRDLGLHFIHEVSLRLSVPSLPDPSDPDGCPPGDDTDSDSHCSGNPSCSTPFSGGRSMGDSIASQIPTLGELCPPPLPAAPGVSLYTLRHMGKSLSSIEHKSIGRLICSKGHG